MKPRSQADLLRRLLACLALAAGLTLAGAQSPAGAALGITPGSGGSNVVTVSIADPGNNLWLLQSSTNLTAWTEVAALKLHNGSFLRSIDAAASPGAAFRAVFEPARQTIPSALTNALLLPATPFNYAAPLLPAKFLIQPILGQDNMPATNLTTDAGATDRKSTRLNSSH